MEAQEVLEDAAEKKEVFVSTIEEEFNTSSPPVSSCGQGTKTSQVRRTQLIKVFELMENAVPFWLVGP